RFIYGDGTYAYYTAGNSNANLPANVQLFNGQDFQSTVIGARTQNTAVDIEARRLEVMAESILIGRDLGIHLARMNEHRLTCADNLDILLRGRPSQCATCIDIANLDNSILGKLWMAADTATITIPVEAVEANPVTSGAHNVERETGVAQLNTPVQRVNRFVFPDFWNDRGLGNNYRITGVDFGLTRRPETELTLEKNLVDLDITTHGGINIISAAGEPDGNAQKGPGVRAIPSSRVHRGVWHVETDVNQLAQGAIMTAVYRYTVINTGEVDRLSQRLIEAYESYMAANNPQGYANYLIRLSLYARMAASFPDMTNYEAGDFLGEAYFTGAVGSTAIVPTRVEVMEEGINNDLTFITATEGAAGVDFRALRPYERGDDLEMNVIVTGEDEVIPEVINTVLRTVRPTRVLEPGDVDNTIEVSLTTTLRGNAEELRFVSHIAEIVSFTNAAGRRLSNDTIPGTLNNRYGAVHPDYAIVGFGIVDYDGLQAGLLEYVHSDEAGVNMEHDARRADTEGYHPSNQPIEFWGETILITDPLGGEDTQWERAMIIAVAAGVVTVVGVGIVVIKKFVLTK
ncbi:MAG: hypothetical protein FWC68_01260, partial [Oscillospiraceae bacterium]|nr:hypothetical protein [Oscillospiraceae bacterium]